MQRGRGNAMSGLAIMATYVCVACVCVCMHIWGEEKINGKKSIFPCKKIIRVDFEAKVEMA